jgi:hypothetical protein
MKTWVDSLFIEFNGPSNPSIDKSKHCKVYFELHAQKPFKLNLCSSLKLFGTTQFYVVAKFRPTSILILKKYAKKVI